MPDTARSAFPIRSMDDLDGFLTGNPGGPGVREVFCGHREIRHRGERSEENIR
jgi:hypothetical protein